MKADELREKYIDFFVSKGHTRISGKSLIPENDPTVLFTTAGMHPLVPFILGEPHPGGKRLVNYQKCIRTGDIDEVGDATHCTFFEMLGNWSLGDYFKEGAIRMSYEFLTSKKWLGFSPEKISVTVFQGDADAPRDDESADIWRSLGIPDVRIYFLPRSDNWWGPAGKTGPCGPDTEMFIDMGKPSCSPQCKPGCNCGKYFEIWNDVFMQYNKTEEGNYELLANKTVDTGMGMERTIAMLQGKGSVFETELFLPVIRVIEEKTGTYYGKDDGTDRSIRIISDHMKASVFILGDEKGVKPSNLGQGYILRRLIRRAIRHMRKLSQEEGAHLDVLALAVVGIYGSLYPELQKNRDVITTELLREEKKFGTTLKRGEREFEKLLPNLLKNPIKIIPGRVAFRLYDTYGFPLEIIEELASEHGFSVDREGFKAAFEKHQELSKQGEKSFKGGLADHSDMVKKLHTATHLLHKALRIVLGDNVEQKGSNITAERLRFDFSHPDKMTDEQLAEVERIVNEQIARDLPVSFEMMSLEEAKKSGSIALFNDKYEETVKVYSMGDFSKEVCGGPHVSSTGELGRFRITKEQSSSAGVRRIRAVLEEGE
jgi:alanyl-tRNA synthetase